MVMEFITSYFNIISTSTSKFQMAFLTPLYTPFPAPNCLNLCYLYITNDLPTFFISTHIY